MMRSMFSGVSGIIAHQTKMDVIGNNISNVNTIGFKSGRVTFQEVFSQTLRGSGAPDNATGRGGTNPMQVGLGLAVSSVDTVTSRGSVQRTDNPTDLSVDGEGFFIVKGGSADAFKFTRAGNFTLDQNGNLVAAGGNNVYGWQDYGGTATSDGTFQFDSEKPIEPINLYSDEYNKNKKMIAAKATTNVSFAGNLDAQEDLINGDPDVKAALKTTYDAAAVISTAAKTVYETALADLSVAKTAYDAAPTDVALKAAYDAAVVVATAAKTDYDTKAATTAAAKKDYDAVKVPDDTNKSVVIPFTVYDSLGNEYKINVDFWKKTSAGGTTGSSTWDWKVSNSSPKIASLSSGTLTFDTKGESVSGASTLKPTVTLTPDPSVGSQPFDIEIDFTKLTQYSADSSAKPSNIDGYASGSLTTFNIAPDGIITGIYSNGQQQPLGLIALAGFENPAGLKKVGDNMYMTTTNSGVFKNGVKPGSQGLGSMNPGTLEMSNVDLSKEFTDMIVTQRGFQANSRIITTSDEMLQELVNLKK